MVYNQNVTIFKKLLEKGNSVIINLSNLTILARELNKTNRNVAAPIMHEIFEDWPTNRFLVRASKTSGFWLKGTQISYSKIWSIVPSKIKNSENNPQFKKKIKSWKPTLFPFNLCQPYFHCLGYI